MKLKEELFYRKGWIFDRDSRSAKITYVGRADTIRIFHVFKNNLEHPINMWAIHGRNYYDHMEVIDTEQLVKTAELMGYEECIMEELKQIANYEK